MVSNLRQPGSARTLLMRQRSSAATKREETTSSVEVKKKGNVIALSSSTDTSAQDLSDQLILLKHLLRGKFGLDSNVPLRRQQNKLKSDAFNMTQQNSLEFIYRASVVPVGESGSVSKVNDIPHDIVLRSLRPNIDWDADKCQRLSDQLLKKISSSPDERNGDCNVHQYQSTNSIVDGKESLGETVLVDDEEAIELTQPQENVVQA